MSPARTTLRRDDAAGPRARARFRRLALTDFRSYAHLDLALDGRPAAFFGPNGAGKTNLLEALSLFGPGRGLRGARLDELPRAGGPGGWAAAAELDVGSDADEALRLGVGAAAAAPGRRVARVDGASARGPGAFAERVRFLWLTPAQDRLFLEGAGERRRFLDRMALARDAAHARVASDYETAMRERQRLLEDGPREASWLQALEARMAAAGVALAAARRETAASLAAAQSAEGAVDLDAYGFPRADVALAGDVEAALGEAPADAVEDAFRARLLALRRRDAEAGRSTYGPHRTDLRVAHRAKGQPARLCSTGEQKALLVGLVLANALTLARGAGAPIVVLLDEIAAHLDADRRAALYDVIEATGLQAFMTGTDKDLFAAWGGRAQGFAIGDGDARETALGG